MKKSMGMIQYLLMSIIASTSCADTSQVRIAQTTTDTKLGNLNWGMGCNSTSVKSDELKTRINKNDSSDNLAKLAVGVINKSKIELNDTIPVVSTLSMEGHEVSDPAYQISLKAVNAVSEILHFALCARLAEASLSDQCAKKASESILNWVSVYKPSGDPIDDSQIIRLFQAIDLMRPLTSQSDFAQIALWIRSFVAQGDSFFNSKMKGHSTATNNWNTWRLAVRAEATTVLGDQGLISETSQMIHAQAKNNFVRDANGKTDGTTLDFIQRDALHYHVYDMTAWVSLADFTPCLLSDDDRASIQAGLDFLQPYFQETKTHQEFANTTVQFDRQRAQNGDPTYKVHTWVATGGIDDGMNRNLIRLARPFFLSIQKWSNNIVTPFYDPVAKFEAKLFGEPLVSN